ncbi:MAG TPA: family 20 glycosylhydrolase [Prevotella sp.]
MISFARFKHTVALVLLVGSMIFVPLLAVGKAIHLLPKPQHIQLFENEKPFRLHRKVVLADPTNCALLRDFLRQNDCRMGTKAAARVEVELTDSLPQTYDYRLAGYENEAYRLEVKAQCIRITAVSPVGVIRAAQTLQQLAEGYSARPAIEALRMVDFPAFKLRGYMHDVGRSFIDVAELERHIVLLSRFKVNTFHWHLTENQAWRFEVKAYPQLTQARHMTRMPGLYYTQEQCRRLEEVARRHGVTIIPEIDMPGHSAAFERAMGFDMQTDRGIEALKQILREVASTFRYAPYIHIGGDEKSITYPHFIRLMTDYVHSLGRRAVVWFPMQGSTTHGADMAQLWGTAGTEQAGMPNIDCRYNYINHFDVFADVVGIYKSNILYRPKGSPAVAGTMAAVWNDHVLGSRQAIVSANNFYASVIASASRAWLGGGEHYIEQGGTVLPNSGPEYDDFCDWERRFLFHKSQSLRNEPIPYVKQTNVRWLVTDGMPNHGDAHAVLPPDTLGTCPSYLLQGKLYRTHLVTGAGVYLRHTWGRIVPTLFSDATANVTAYAWTYVYSPKRQMAGAHIEFQNYSRSEQDAAPPFGQWDRKGSRIWLNGCELLPPVWAQAGRRIDNETPLQNENFTGRKPLMVQLEKGWNKVFLKLPYVAAEGIRLNKWMFTFVLTNASGTQALEGIEYNPTACFLQQP